MPRIVMDLFFFVHKKDHVLLRTEKKKDNF